MAITTLHTATPSSRAIGWLTIAICNALFASAHAGQTEADRIAELERKLEKSLALIEQLSTRLGEMEARQAGTSKAYATTEQVNTQSERMHQLESALTQVAEGAAKHNELGLPLHGFADVGYLHSTHDPNGRKDGFSLGSLDIYLTPVIGDRVKSIVELVFEYDGAGMQTTDLERLQFGYTFCDAATLWVGRFHTPYGHWNTAFHHGLQIQTAASRPRLVDFEDRGGILPAHAVGLLASGGVRAGQGKLFYDAYLANGDSIREGVLNFNAFKDDNDNKLVGGNIRYAFGGRLEGLTLGLHALSQQVDDSAIGASTKVNIVGGFAALDTGRWEAIAEYYNFRNDDLSGFTGVHRSWAGFAQVGYELSDRWIPYLRFEKAVLDQTDNYFLGQTSGRSYQRNVLGLRYNLNTQSALKVELNETTDEWQSGPSKTNEARLQLAVRF